MDTITLLRDDLRVAHELMESTLGDPTPEQLHYLPAGRALPMGAAYAHTLFSEDYLVHGLKGEPPILESGINTGASEPMPNFMAGDWAGYADWTKRARFDLPALRDYAKQVYAATDAYLASLSEADLDREVEFFRSSLGSMICRGLIGHVDNLTGEISATRGLQGLQGYPF
jgi:hypothetical protein